MLRHGSRIPASSNASTASAVYWVQRRTGFELSLRGPLIQSWGPKSIETSKHCTLISLFLKDQFTRAGDTLTDFSEVDEVRHLHGTDLLLHSFNENDIFLGVA